MVLVVMLVFSSLIVLILYIKSRKYGISDMMLLGACVKMGLCYVGTFAILPFGEDDAITFEQVAREWSRYSYTELLATADVTASYLYSTITALLYKSIDREIAIPVFINGILGLFIFYNAIVLGKKIWGKAASYRTFAFIVAFHPMLNVNSAITMRENYISLLILLAAIHLANYIQRGGPVSMLLFFLFCLLSSFFHGGMIVFALGLPAFMIASRSEFSLPMRLLLSVSFVAGFIALFNFISFGKISSVQETGLTMELLMEIENSRLEASTAYLVGLTPNTPLDVVWQTPLRLLYFLIKPFPWDVRSPGMVIVYLDALLWTLILLLVVLNWRDIARNPSAMAILICCVIAMIAFAYGTGNFGTAVRHRTKFLVIMLAVVSAFMPRMKLFKYAPRFRHRLS